MRVALLAALVLWAGKVDCGQRGGVLPLGADLTSPRPLAVACGADLSRPGGAGHALLFRDHGIKIENFRDLGSDAFTFEAWVRTSDSCHRAALFSYALPSTAASEAQRTADFNHFVIFDPNELVACHAFEYM